MNGSKRHTYGGIRKQFIDELQSEQMSKRLYNSIENISRLLNTIITTKGKGWAAQVLDEEGNQILTNQEQEIMTEKLEPYMISFIDNFEKIIGETMTRKLRELGIISIQPLAFVRGRSIDNTVIIVDEAQNISVPNMRTLMTRIGNDSKMVILGDVKQRDIKKKSDSSLEIIINKFDNKEDFGTVTLRDEGDIVRNPLIKTIEEIFDDIEETK